MEREKRAEKREEQHREPAQTRTCDGKGRRRAMQKTESG